MDTMKDPHDLQPGDRVTFSAAGHSVRFTVATVTRVTAGHTTVESRQGDVWWLGHEDGSIEIEHVR